MPLSSRMFVIAFDEKVVLNGISFHLHHGETKALFGVAGSGKSVLLKLAMGLMRAGQRTHSCSAKKSPT